MDSVLKIELVIFYCIIPSGSNEMLTAFARVTSPVQVKLNEFVCVVQPAAIDRWHSVRGKVYRQAVHRCKI
jgi:hypothetical protein